MLCYYEFCPVSAYKCPLPHAHKLLSTFLCWFHRNENIDNNNDEKKMFIQSEVWNVYNKNNQRFENVYVQISNFVVFRLHMTLGYVQRVWWVSAIKYTHTKVICHCLTSQMNLWHFFHSIFVLTLSEGRGDCAVSVWQRIDNFLSLQFPRIQWAIEMRMTQI